MEESVKKLRAAYAEYLRAKQVRYDELMEPGGRENLAGCLEYTGSEMLDLHKKVVERISLEESAPEYERVEDIFVKCTAAYVGGRLMMSNEITEERLRK